MEKQKKIKIMNEEQLVKQIKQIEEQKKIIEAVLDNYEFRRQPPNYPPHPAEIE